MEAVEANEDELNLASVLSFDLVVIVEPRVIVIVVVDGLATPLLFDSAFLSWCLLGASLTMGSSSSSSAISPSSRSSPSSSL